MVSDISVQRSDDRIRMVKTGGWSTLNSPLISALCLLFTTIWHPTPQKPKLGAYRKLRGMTNDDWRIVDVALRGVGATTPTSPLPARRLYRLTGRRGGCALSFQFKPIALLKYSIWLWHKSWANVMPAIRWEKCRIQHLDPNDDMGLD